MDATALAAIIIGFGSTLAAMALPLKYPTAPRWVLEGSWWGGLSLIFVGLFYLLTGHPLGDLGGAVIAAFDWFSNLVVELQRLPGFWIVIAFAGGVAADRWLYPLSRTKRASTGSQVKEWLTPHQAIEEFVSPGLLVQSRRTGARARELRDRVKLLEINLQDAQETEREALQIQFDAMLEECRDMEYLAASRLADVMDNLYDQLKLGRLVGKGYKVKNGNVKKQITYINADYWKLSYVGIDLLNIETGVASNMLRTYQNVLIGKNDGLPDLGDFEAKGVRFLPASQSRNL